MTIRAVIFDLGHTLWDIQPHAEALQRAYIEAQALLCERLQRADLPAPAVMQRAVRDVLVAASETYFSEGPNLDQPRSHTWVDRACRALGLELEDALLREITPGLFAAEQAGFVVHEGTLEAVESLAEAGYTLGCITNTLADTATVRRYLSGEGFERHMQTVIVSADEGWRKPHPHLFERALTEIGAPPHEAAYVGDSPLHDVGGAKNAGMYAVLTRQYATRPPVEGVPDADAEITHLRELPAVLKKLDALTKSVDVRQKRERAG
jgi:FMN hydrolase / 5-amino-6-(5-phospho-D-ribitylamino)uracil phosphatase